MTPAAYLSNKSPAAAQSFNTPEEIWNGKPSNYNILKVVCCVAFAHVKKDKLEPITLKCVFIGYPI